MVKRGGYMNDEESLKKLVQGIRNSIGKLISTSEDNVYVMRGTIELAIESVFHNFLAELSKVLLVGRRESLEYIEYICELCNLKYNSIYVIEDELPLSKIVEALNTHYDAIYLPYAEINSGVIYNISNLVSNINTNNLLVIINISNGILMNPTQLNNGVDIVVGGMEVFDSMCSFVGINDKAKTFLNGNINYFIDYLDYDTYLATNERWINEYKLLNDTLLNVIQLDSSEWYFYFSYLVSFIRTKIRLMGYQVIPYTNYANAYIVINVENAEKICEELYNKYQIIVRPGYKNMHNSRIIIDMNNYRDISSCLKLLQAFRGLDLK